MLQIKNGARKSLGSGYFFCLNRQEAANASGHVALHRGSQAVCICEACVGGREGSDRQRYKTVVLLDVALENIRARTQDAFESGAVELHALQWATGNDCGSTRAVHQESYFTWIDTKGSTGESQLHASRESGPRHAVAGS